MLRAPLMLAVGTRRLCRLPTRALRRASSAQPRAAPPPRVPSAPQPVQQAPQVQTAYPGQTNWCLQQCTASCAAVNPYNPNNYIANGDSCITSGASYGPSAASAACNEARARCEGRAPYVAAPRGGVGPVTLPQCSRIALGSCQQAAANSRCLGVTTLGYRNCDRATFQSYFDQAATSACTNWAKTATNVDPNSGQWAGGGGVYPIGTAAPGAVVVNPRPGTVVVNPVAPVIGGLRPLGPGGVLGSSGPRVVGASAPTVGAPAPGGGGSVAVGGRRRALGTDGHVLRA